MSNEKKRTDEDEMRTLTHKDPVEVLITIPRRGHGEVAEKARQQKADPPDPRATCNQI